MVLIFSKSGDTSTDDIQLWLNHCEKEVFRLSEFDALNQIEIDSERDLLVYNGGTVDLKKVDAVLFRRSGGLRLETPRVVDGLSHSYSNYLTEYEYLTVLEYVHASIADRKHLNNIFDVKNHKLRYLQEARKCGLLVPDWIVTSSIDRIEEFSSQHEKIITKALNMPYFSFTEGEQVFEVAYSTNVIEDGDLDRFVQEYGRDSLLPSFFQAYVEKKIEIRAFYLDGQFYSMAIFSQQSELTKEDFRNYDRTNPNSLVPFQLPKEVEGKLTALIEQFAYKTCSVDLIYSTDKKFYFLEINPIGQFKWMSEACNYYIEEKMASYLA